MQDRPFRPEELLEHRDFLRGLARALVGSSLAADDVIQETYLVALQKQPRSGGSLRAWLATVLRSLASNRRRGDRRRVEREQVASRAEAISDLNADSAPLRVAQEVIAAVQSLDHGYRQVIYLRYFEELSVPAIANRLGIPRETAKTRLRRGLSQLRTRMDDIRGGDRNAWFSALGPLAYSWGAPSKPLVVHGMADWALDVWRILSMKKVMGLTALAMILVTGSTLLLSSDRGEGSSVIAPGDSSRGLMSGSMGDSGSTELAPLGASSQVGNSVDSLGLPVRSQALEAAPLPSSESLFTLSVQVRWEKDRSVASGIGMLVYPSGFRDDQNVRRACSNRDGLIELRGLPPGRVVLQAFRGGLGVFEIPTEQQVEFLVPQGLDVEGRVLGPDGQPVGGAEIWISRRPVGWLGSFRAARSSADGSYRLRGVQTDRSISARSNGFGPSLRQGLEHRRSVASEPVRLDLELSSAGGEVAGRVIDHAGQPVPDAWVGVGSDQPHSPGLNGVHIPVAPPVLAKTAEEGDFQITGIGAGPSVAVRVMAQGFAPASKRVEVHAGKPTQVVVQLERGAALSGTVSDAEGNPLSNARVYPALVDGDKLEQAFFPLPTALTSADGSYVLEGLGAGQLSLEAHSTSEFIAPAKASLSVALGGSYTWSPQLSQAWEISGQLVDQDGHPLGDWRVSASLENGSGNPPTLCGTDREGRFALYVSNSGLYGLNAGNGSPETDRLVGKAIAAGTTGMLLSVETDGPGFAIIKGEILDDGAGLAAQERIRVDLDQGARSLASTEVSDGGFRVGPVPPGTYHLVVRAAGQVLLKTKALVVEADDALDVGSLRIAAPGRLSVEVVALSDGPQSDQRFIAIDGERLARYALRRDGNRLVHDRLPPGSYRLWGAGKDAAIAATNFEIRSGQETSVSVSLVRGTRRTFRFSSPSEAISWPDVALEIVDDMGKPVFKGSAAYAVLEESPPFFEYTFPIGTFEILVQSGELSARRRIEISDFESVEQAIEIELLP